MKQIIHFLCLLAVALLPVSLTVAAPVPEKRPNIVVMILDDMGFSDLGCYGGEVQSPNLDRLAAEGVRFTQFRNAGRCCPTRGSLLTGLYPHQSGLGGMEGPRKQDTKFSAYKGALHENCVTIAEVLKPLGYRTYAVGKWHVGFPENGASPIQRGFDHWLGVYEGWADYDKKVVEKKMLVEDDRIVEQLPADFQNITYLYSDKAIAYMTADPKTPFFVYLPHIAPHFNLGPLPANEAKYQATFAEGWDVLREQRFARQKEFGLFPADMKMGPRYWRVPAWTGLPEQQRNQRAMQKYAAAIDEVDQGIGKIVAALKQTGQWDNTLFLFMSDNGSYPLGKETGWGDLSNTPFSYYKQQLFEGGVATPLIAVWPGRFPAGGINKVQPGHVKDIMATCIEAAGATYPAEFKGKPIFPLEGQSLLHAMRDPGSYRDPGIVGWEHQGHRALIDGDWKLVALYHDDSPAAIAANPKLQLHDTKGARTGKWRLFNLKTDRAETEDLAAKMPEKVAELEKKYFAWAARTKVMEREELKKLWKME